MSSWTKEARKIAQGKWIRFDAQQPIHTLLFVGEPTRVEKTSQMGPSKGEKYFQMSFPVLEDGDERILEPNKSLLTQLIEEDEEEPIVGSELMIKCLNPEKKTSWKVKRIAGNHAEIQTWKKDEDKDKFMEEVKKTKAKKAKKEDKVTEPEGETDDDRSADETAET